MSISEQIKSRLDIVEFIGESVPLRKAGKSYTGFCPFHSNTRTPSFVVFPDSQSWRCFGACAEGGDVFGFVMKKEGLDFREALVRLAERAGVRLEEVTPKANQDSQERLYQLLRAAADYYHHLLLHAPQAEQARQYLSGRALPAATIETFQLGYALDSWDSCRNHFQMQGYNDDELVAVGLLSENPERHSRYDRFRNRVMIPIADETGRIIGFGARTLDKDGQPKYLNSPETPLFSKGHILFGLHLARRHIREARQAVIVEGYLDMISAWQAGFQNVVAQMGTALTPEQLNGLKRYTRRFIIALDGDPAGAKATLRSLEVARQTLDREADVSGFDIRGLVQQEGRLKADIRVVSLPAGYDPDSLIRRAPDHWAKLVEQARPVVTFVIETLCQEIDYNDPKAKSAIVQQVIPLIQDIADPVERDHYRQLLARSVQIDERILRQMMAPAGKRPPTQSPTIKPAIPLNGIRLSLASREADYLRHCLLHPQLITKIDGRLSIHHQSAVTPADFATTEDKALQHFLGQQGQRVASVDELWDILDDFLISRAKNLLSGPQRLELEPERLPDRLTLTILDIRLEKMNRLLKEVQQLFKEAAEQQNQEALEMYRQQLREIPQQLQSINRAKWAMSASGRRQTEENNAT